MDTPLSWNIRGYIFFIIADLIRKIDKIRTLSKSGIFICLLKGVSKNVNLFIKKYPWNKNMGKANSTLVLTTLEPETGTPEE